MRRSEAELIEGHLWQIDVVRLIAFSAVIAVHSIDYTQLPTNKVAGGALMLLQFGREIFFALTGFVLVHVSQARSPKAWSFWRRRLPAVVMPYLAWTTIYWFYGVVGPANLPATWSSLWFDVRTGGALYHLYFLLVTMQLYLAFPTVLRFVRRTSDHPLRALASVAAINLAWLAVLQYAPAPSGTMGFFWHHAYELLPTYSVYVLAGCYAALNLARLQAFVNRRSRQLPAVAAVAGGLAIVAYVAQLGSRAPRDAAAVLQPAMFLTSAGAAIMLYLAGSRWAAGPRRHAPAVRVASDISFGVFLAHPLFLLLLTDNGIGNGGHRVPSIVATMLGFVVPLAGATSLTLLARRTPLSLVLVGRRRLPRRSDGPRFGLSTAPSDRLPAGTVGSVAPASVAAMSHMGRELARP